MVDFDFKMTLFFKCVNDTLSVLNIGYIILEHSSLTVNRTFSQLSDIDYSILVDSFRAILLIAMFIQELSVLKLACNTAGNPQLPNVVNYLSLTLRHSAREKIKIIIKHLLSLLLTPNDLHTSHDRPQSFIHRRCIPATVVVPV